MNSSPDAAVVVRAALMPALDEIAASLLMQGVTASHVATEFYAFKPYEVALVHAASGVGLMLTQIVKLRGGRVIGRVSTEDKAELALLHG
jgi:NADPH2:quinone reductase